MTPRSIILGEILTFSSLLLRGALTISSQVHCQKMFQSNKHNVNYIGLTVSSMSLLVAVTASCIPLFPTIILPSYNSQERVFSYGYTVWSSREREITTLLMEELEREKKY